MRLKFGNLRRGIIHPRTSQSSSWGDPTFYLSFNTNFVDSLGRTWGPRVSNAAPTISNTTFLSGGGSMYNSAGSGGLTRTDPSFVLGEKDFRFTFWYNPDFVGNNTNVLLETLTNDNSTTNPNFYLGTSNTNIFIDNIVRPAGSTNAFSLSMNGVFPTIKRWYFVDVYRINKIWTMTVDNSRSISGTNAIMNMTSNNINIGAKGPRNAGANYGANGYIDEFYMWIK